MCCEERNISLQECIAKESELHLSIVSWMFIISLNTCLPTCHSRTGESKMFSSNAYFKITIYFEMIVTY